MTRDELRALRRVCSACGGRGMWHGTRMTENGIEDGEDTVCEVCAGTGYVLPATEEVLGLAGAALPPDPVAAVCAIVSHDCAVAIPQALMLLSKEYGLSTEQATELLVRAARLRPECLYLERTSASVVGYYSDERGKTITIDGYLRSHARIMPSRLEPEKARRKAEEADTADFWREVALKAAEATDYDYPMNWDAERRLAEIADEVRAARRKAEEA